MIACAHAADGYVAVRRASQQAQAVSCLAPPQVDARPARTLSFRSDPATSTRVERETTQVFGRNTQQVADLGKVIGSGELLRQFGGILRCYGYDPTNLGDVLAMHLLISCEVANDRSSVLVPDGQRAVRRQ